MADIIIREFPGDDVTAMDAEATPRGTVTREDLEWFSETFQDLADEEVMRGAWE